MGKKETNISPQFSLLDSTDVKLLRIARNAFKAEGSVVKNPPADGGDASSIPGQEDPLEKEVATHSSILAWEPHGQRSLAGYSPRGHKRVRHDLATEQQHFPLELSLFCRLLVDRLWSHFGKCWHGGTGVREKHPSTYFCGLIFCDRPLDGNKAPRTRVLLGFVRIGTY